MGSLELYSKAAHHSAATVIRDYSTSFGLATNLLPAQIRSQIRDIYALVRVADEIVDGAAAEARGTKKVPLRAELDLLEDAVYQAMATGFSTNLVVHAFARTANVVGIDRDMIAPFFASMRMDLSKKKHTAKSFAEYVYGSAEVIGLMCTRAFIAGREDGYSALEAESIRVGALALGAAFQKINFLRDLQADFGELGRSYFPGVSVSSFNEDQKFELVDDIRFDLKTAALSIVLLPRDVRPAVSAAHSLFAELTDKVASTPADVLISTRISVSNGRKLWLLVKALLGVKP